MRIIDDIRVRAWRYAIALAILIIVGLILFVPFVFQNPDVPKHKGIILHNIQIDTTIPNLSPDSTEVQDSTIMDSTKEEK